MKKAVIIVSVILLILIIICFMGVSANKTNMQAIKKENNSYEQYQNKEIYGTDVVSLINKAVNENKNNNIELDEDEKYIQNETNSINIEIVLITNEEKLETTTYSMETIQKVGISEFISNFNIAKFRITKLEYHEKTGRIKYIEITQQY